MEATALAAASKPSFASTSSSDLEAVDRPSSSLHSHLQRRRRLLLRTRGFANSLLPTRRWKGGCLLYAYVLYKSKLLQGRSYWKTFGGTIGVFVLFFAFSTTILKYFGGKYTRTTALSQACKLEMRYGRRQTFQVPNSFAKIWSGNCNSHKLITNPFRKVTTKNWVTAYKLK